jgi:hypothetical protein
VGGRFVHVEVGTLFPLTALDHRSLGAQCLFSLYLMAVQRTVLELGPQVITKPSVVVPSREHDEALRHFAVSKRTNLDRLYHQGRQWAALDYRGR